MNRYDSYKPTEIQSLEHCPENWVINRIKSLGSIRYGLGQPPRELENGLPIIRATNIFAGRISSQNLILVDPSDLPYERKPILKKGEIIVVRSGAYTGDSAIIPSEFHGAVSGYDMVFTPNKKLIYPKYIAYCLLSNYVFKDQLVLTSLRAAQPHLNKEELGSTLIAFSLSKKEQTVVAKYLDNKTEAIDKKLGLLEKKIGYYQELRKSLINEIVTGGLDKSVKLKESGIDWIRQIPKHWEVKRIKDCFKLFTGNSISDKSNFEISVDSIPYVATKDIDFQTGNITYDNGIFIPKNDYSFKRAKPHTTLICIEGANAGKKIGFTEKEVAFVNKLCVIKSNTSNNCDKYLYYFVQTNLFNIQFFSILNGLIGGVSVSLIRQLNILMPPRGEQLEIVKYLDLRLSLFDKITSNIQGQIVTLKELRKTLINDVVTGKIKVIND